MFLYYEYHGQWKRSLCLLSRKCNDLELKIYYKHYCSVLGRVVREAKKLYYSELIAHSEYKAKMTWKIIKNLIGRIQNSQHVSPTFKVDGIEQSPKQAAEAFNNYFLNITENLNIHIAKDNTPISLLKIYYPFQFPPMQILCC